MTKRALTYTGSGRSFPLSTQAKRDAMLKTQVRRVFNEKFGVYGVPKVRRQMKREGFEAARCTLSRLIREMDLRGVVRGRSMRTTIPDASAPCPLDRVDRVFEAPRLNMLSVSDFTYVATWNGFVYVADDATNAAHLR